MSTEVLADAYRGNKAALVVTGQLSEAAHLDGIMEVVRPRVIEKMGVSGETHRLIFDFRTSGTAVIDGSEEIFALSQDGPVLVTCEATPNANRTEEAPR
jgi:hypothetical protein